MKKSDFTGWKTIFDFTLKQNLKTKSNIITTIVFLVICIASFPVMSLINGNNSVKASSIKEVKIINNSDIDILASLEAIMSQYEKYKDIKYTNSSEKEQALEKKLMNAKNDCKYVMMVVGFDEEKGYEVSLKYGDKSSVDSEDLSDFASDLQEQFSNIIANSIGVSDESLEIIKKDVTTNVVTNATSEFFDKKEEDGISMNQYSVLLFMMTITVFMIALSGEGVSGTIVTEKSSKIVEVLLTSVRPMAIIGGKVLAVFVVSVGEILLMAVSLFASYLLNGIMLSDFSANSIPTNLRGVISKEVFGGISVINVIVSILVLFAGIMFYEIFAGLVGSTVNKVEEMAEGMKLYQLTMILSSYVTIGIAIACMAGSYPKTIIIIACICPLTAAFCLPGFLLIGKLNMLISVISIISMFVFLFLLLLFTANVYEDVIYHNGDKMKFKDVIRLFRANYRKAGATNEK